MPINVTNQEADELTRKFAEIAGVGITEAIVIAMREAIERRTTGETPMQTAARLRTRHNVNITESARDALPDNTLDKMWEGK